MYFQSERLIFREFKESDFTLFYSVFSNEQIMKGNFTGFADIEIHNKNSNGGCGEIGYFLLPSFWGNGFATEIANTLIKMCFRQINLHRIVASCNANNLQSEKIMKKVGMIKEGEFRKARFKNGQWDNEMRYSILIDEWKENNYLS